jgi:hypothetical protein
LPARDDEEAAYNPKMARAPVRKTLISFLKLTNYYHRSIGIPSSLSFSPIYCTRIIFAKAASSLRNDQEILVLFRDGFR